MNEIVNLIHTSFPRPLGFHEIVPPRKCDPAMPVINNIHKKMQKHNSEIDLSKKEAMFLKTFSSLTPTITKNEYRQRCVHFNIL